MWMIRQSRWMTCGWRLHADGAESVVSRMQVVEEVIDEEANFQGSAGAGVLPPDGRVRQRLEKELESARLKHAGQMLREEDYSSEGAGSDDYKGCVEESFSASADGGFDRVAKSAELEGDVRRRAAITAMAPAGTAGARRGPEGVDDAAALAGADDDCGTAEVAQSEKFWADVGGSSPDPTCIGGELAGGGMKATGATTAGAVVPVSGAGSQRLPWAMVPGPCMGR